METIAFFGLIILAAVAFYFISFSDKKKHYPEDKIVLIFDAALDLVIPQPDDHEVMIKSKKNIAEHLIGFRKDYTRKPSIYSKDEIEDLEEMSTRIKKMLSEHCEGLIDVKIGTIKVLESSKKLLKVSDETTNVLEKLESSKNTEDMLDSIESRNEFMPLEIKKLEDELNIIEANIKKYLIK